MKWTRSLRSATLGFVAILATAGCVKSDQKIAIAKDGSGTINVTFTSDTSKLNDIMEVVKAMIPQAPAAPAPAPGGDAGMGDAAMGDAAMGDEKPKEESVVHKRFSKEMIEKQLKTTEGNELKEHSIETKDGKDVVHMLIAFKSLENLCKSGALVNLAVNLVKNEDGSYTLTLDAKAGMGSGDGADGMDMLTAMLPTFEPMLSGMAFKTEVAIPGSIIETNGAKSEDGTKATWNVDWKAVSGADTTKKDATIMKVSFKGEGIDWKPFSYKPDVMALAGKLGFSLK